MRLANQFQSLNLNLAHGELLSCIDAKTSLKVSCIKGALWITSETEAGDIVLNAGEETVMAPGPLVIVQALANSDLTIVDGSVLREA